MRLLQIAVCAVLLASPLMSVAQTTRGDMVIDVPFAFSVSGKSLPACHYIVKAVDESHLRIFNFHTVGLYLSTHDAIRPNAEGSKLEFHRYGDTYFLSSVWITGNQIGKELARSRAEREMVEHKAEMELAVVRPEK